MQFNYQFFDKGIEHTREKAVINFALARTDLCLKPFAEYIPEYEINDKSKLAHCVLQIVRQKKFFLKF